MNREKYLEKVNYVIREGKYKDTWSSLAQYEVPRWYTNAKFGIFIHWGIYSVPAFSNEWYSRNMYVQGSPEFEHHINTYGAHKEFGYKDFIPLFRAEKFDPSKWAELFKASGAKYVCPVAEHHDGFQMYNSELSEWNSVRKGPKRDVLGELKEAVEKEGLKCGASSHRVEHWFFMGHGKEFDSDIKEPMLRGDFYWPAMPEQDHYDLYSEPYPSQEFLEDWLLRCCEILDSYRPNMVYFDWWIQHESVKPYLKKFAAYYYNQAIKWGKEVVINYKHDAFQFGCAVVDVERGQFADIKPFYWQTDTSVARNSWCYTEGNDYKSVNEIICDLVDIVSKNGNMMLNIGPKADGTIPAEDEVILRGIGEWLQINGEAIYDTQPWRYSGEGPAKIKEGQFTDGASKVFTSEDIRFTLKKDAIYATVLKWPQDGRVLIKALAENADHNLPLFHGIIRDVAILGCEEKPDYMRTKVGLEIKAKGIDSELPIVIKVTVD